MYFVRIEATVQPGKLRAFEAFLDQVYAIIGKAPGFRRAGVLASIAYPGRHTSLSIWDSAAAAAAFGRGDAYQEVLAKNSVTALVTPVRPAEGYEVVHRVQDRPLAEAGAVQLVDIAIDPTQAAAFESMMQTRLNLRLRVGHGLVSNTLGRSLAGTGRYLLYFVHTTDEALTATMNAPEVRSAREAHPPTAFGGQITGSDRGMVVKSLEPALVA